VPKIKYNQDFSFIRQSLKIKKSRVPLYYGGGKESDLQQYIHKHVGGERELQTEAGAIDLLTPTRLIEVKEYKGWKGALGQLLSYDYALNQNPNEIWLQKLTVVLYWLTVPPRAELNTMFSTFKHFNIEVFTTWSKDEHSLQNLLDNA